MPYPDAKYPYDQRLVRAAPELLAAAQSMQHAFYYGDANSEMNAMIKLRKAIAKAEGKESE